MEQGKRQALTARPLYIVAAVLGISVALWVRPWVRAVLPAPQDESEARQAGFKSFTEEQEVGDLLNLGSISRLNSQQRDLLAGVLSRSGSCRWMALGVIAELKGTELQKSVIPAIRPQLLRGEESPMARAVLEGWLKRDGRQTLELLARDGEPAISKLASSVLAGGTR